ncbi:MAG: hypothetical protein ACK56F_20065, partial [bacterium]
LRRRDRAREAASPAPGRTGSDPRRPGHPAPPPGDRARVAAAPRRLFPNRGCPPPAASARGVAPWLRCSPKWPRSDRKETPC